MKVIQNLEICYLLVLILIGAVIDVLRGFLEDPWMVTYTLMALFGVGFVARRLRIA